MKFKPNKAGFYDVRRMPKLISLLEDHAERVADEANGLLGDHAGYLTGSRQGKKGPSRTGGRGYQGRWRASVFTFTEEAKRADAEHNLLLKALHG